MKSLIYLITQQKAQIAKAYLEAFSEEEEDKTCQEVIKIHHQWFVANKEKNFSNSVKLSQQLFNLRSQLKSRLGDKFDETIEAILTDFSELYQREWDLQKQTKEKSEITQFQTELEELRKQTETSFAELKTAIKDKAEISEEKREQNKQLIAKVEALTQYKNDTNNQLTNEQKRRLQNSSFLQSLADDNLADFQAQIQFSNQE